MRFNMRRAAGLAAAVGCGVWVTARPADAAIRVDGRSSSTNVTASAQGFIGSPDTDSDQKSTTSLTDNFSSIVNALAQSFGTEGESEARQTSSLTYTNGNLSRVQGTGSVTVSVFASGGGAADARGTSDLTLQFTVPAGESYNFSFTGNLTDTSTRTTVAVYLEDVARNAYPVDRAGNTGTFTASGRLLPGGYVLNARAFGLASDVSPGSGDSDFTIDMTLTPVAVPEPAAASLLLAASAGLLVRRRQRRAQAARA